MDYHLILTYTQESYKNYLFVKPSDKQFSLTGEQKSKNGSTTLKQVYPGSHRHGY